MSFIISLARARAIGGGRTVSVKRQSVLIIPLVLAGVIAEPTFTAARYRGGPLPALPPVPVTSVGGGEVILEVTVDRGGRVTALKPLRTTPPFTDLVSDAVKQWQFTAARELVKLSPTDSAPAAAAIESKVAVAAVFRRPAMYAPTLGQAPADAAGPSLEIAFPVTVVEPPHPPNAFAAGVVLVELRIDRDGNVAEAAVVGSAPAHDSAALTAARAWKFRPARFKGETVETRAYILFGFPVPVTG